MTPIRSEHVVLSLSGPDSPGIVHAVTGALVDAECTIVESQQFRDPIEDAFFLRVGFARAGGGELDVDALRRRVSQVADRFGMTWRLDDASRRARVVIMVSKFAHCLNDLLFRNSIGELNLDVVAVVSNHPDLVRDEHVDLVVLARYMQILSDDLCKRLDGRAINIHHSMLPSFKGARPYHQAHARGVKFIGTTAHCVTADLDEGPIIEQEILRVDHSLAPDQLAARGREAETRALARAVRWHTENRVTLNGNRTVVFG